MKRYALIVVTATLLAGCVSREQADCDTATYNGEDFDLCMAQTNKAQFIAHQSVIKTWTDKK